MPTKAQREKQEAKRQRRLERREQRSLEEQRLRARRRLRLAGIGIAGVLVVAALGAGFWLAFLQPRPGESVATSGSGVHTGAPAGGYSTSPPTSGPHTPDVPDWGEHNTEVAEVLQVHALEHGGVLMQYNCPSGCGELVGDLSLILSDYPSKVILAPYSNMEALIALTAWGKIDLLDEFDEGRIRNFVDKNRNHGPEDVPD